MITETEFVADLRDVAQQDQEAFKVETVLGTNNRDREAGKLLLADLMAAKDSELIMATDAGL